MNKLLVPLAICIILALLITSCSSSPSTSTTAATTTPVTTAPSTTAPAATTSSATTPAASTSQPAPTTQPASGTPKYGGTLKYVSGWSPAMNVGWPLDNDWSGIWLVNFIYAEPLVFYRIDGKVDPMLAESWEYGSDTKSVTFHLRKGVKFHDGTDFNADAAKFMLDSNIEAKTNGTSNWKSVDLVDDYTVRLNLSEFSNSLWSTLATKACQIVSPTGVRKNGKDWAREHPVGTGPFKYVSFTKDTNAVFEKNTDYWQKGKPYIDRLEFVFVKEEMTQQSMMLSGEGQILTNAAGRTLSDMKAKGFQTPANAAGTDFLAPNSAKPGSFFANPKAREALEYAIDKAAICKALGYGYMTPNSQLTPPSHPYFNTALPERGYNVEKAKQLLTEAGMPNGFKTKIATQALWKDEALAVQNYLKKVGIETEVEVLDPAKWWDESSNGWDGFLYAGFSFGPNFANSFKSQFPPYATTSKDLLMPEGIKDILDKAIAEPDAAKQAELNKQLVKAMYDNSSISCVLSNAIGYVVAANVRDGHWLEGDAWQYWNPATIWLDK